MYSLVPILVVGLATVLASSEIGWQLGLRAKGRGRENMPALEQSVLALLALIIGFTFLMALTRYESRREAVLNEANAIGTTALRARLLPDPHRTAILKLLREYTQIRIEYIGRGLSFAELPEVIQRSNEIQEALWQQAKAVVATDKEIVPTLLFIQTLNELIDNQAKRLSALRNQIPNIVLLSLFVIAAVGGAFAGYAGALEPQRTRLPVYALGFLVSAVIILILDIDRPNVGFVTISQQPMIDVAASIAALPD
jgi:hypothetical protein